MLKVGITGGIGSGKTTVCQVFKTLGIPVLHADEAGRYLMENDALVIDGIKMLFGEAVYKAGVLDREQVSNIVFKRPGILEQLNTIVHPATIRYGRQWMEAQQGPYAIKEAAIFFESGSYTEMDVMIGVYAPRKIRILRATKRDNVPQEKILKRMSHQMSELEKMKRCHHVITNDGKKAIIPQVMLIHEKLLAQSATHK
jgi:dephospho-CoA kinase